MLLLGITYGIVWFKPENKEQWLQLLTADDQYISILCSASLLYKLNAICLRLDYANYVANVEAAEGSPVNLIALEVVPAPKSKCPDEKFTSGVIIPTWMTDSFACPYFGSVLTAWFLANVGVTEAIRWGFLPDLGRFVYTGYLLLLAIPMVVLAIVATAMARGEMRRMWTYEEIWTMYDESPENASPNEKDEVALDSGQKAGLLV